MFANQKKALAILGSLVIAICGGTISALLASKLGASALESVSVGGVAFVSTCTLGLVIIGMCQFTEDRPAPSAN
ncbi:hypothetical protein ACIREO_38060 [Streptomyces sp. NPDC102441]|uniref:hypothetical protein n=1 Tax=Streptomyces sp. NPDC102441 TaxID=3366176 RepID=UPI00381F0B73